MLFEKLCSTIQIRNVNCGCATYIFTLYRTLIASSDSNVTRSLRSAGLEGKAQKPPFFSGNMQNGARHQHCVSGKGLMVCCIKASGSYIIVILLIPLV